MFVTSAGAFRYRAAEAMYKLVKGVSEMTTQDTMDLFFPPAFNRPGMAVQGERYYDSGATSSASAPSPSTTHADAPVQADEGFLAEDHPDGAIPEARRDALSPFVQRIIASEFSTPTAGSSSEWLRARSPRSVDSGEHSSDAEFIDDSNM